MSEVIVYMQDGQLHRVIPYYAGGFTVESEMKVVPKDADYKVLNNSSMPSSILRNAWRLQDDAVDVDIEKGKTVSHELRRDKRAEMLEDNLAILTKNGAGIPLSPSENAATAASENAAYMLIDDAAQVSIDASTSEAELLSALNDIGVS